MMGLRSSPFTSLPFFPHLLFFKGVLVLCARDLEMCAEESHIGQDLRGIMDFLGSSVWIHWTEREVLIHYLAILEEFLQTSHDIQLWIIHFKCNRCLYQYSWKVMDVTVIKDCF